MNNIVDRLINLHVPEKLFRQEAGQAWESLAQGLLSEDECYSFLEGMVDILRSSEFNQLIQEGKVTLAAIRPRLESSVLPDAAPGVIFDDSRLADFLFSQIKSPLEVICHFSIMMSPELVEEFYSGGPKQNMEKSPPEYPDRYGNRPTNRWGEWLEYMTSGPTTFAILYSPEGDAISVWRNQMGNNRRVEVLKTTNPESLRAVYAIDSDKNLFHGSSSEEEVLREIKIISGYLERMLQN